MSYEGIGPRLVGYQVAHKLYQYIQRALDLGALEGPLGEMQPSPELWRVLEAVNIVLSGGAVKIEVQQRGNPDIVHELNRLLSEAMTEANEINKKSGFYVTAL
jgi:hypothetical protein